MTSWDILIPSITHRTDMLTDLLEHLKKQLVPGVGVIVYRDNRGEPVH
jgi:spore maturation protein CgeB